MFLFLFLLTIPNKCAIIFSRLRGGFIVIREYMIDLGYSDSDIDKIINTYPLTNCVENTLCSKVISVYNFLAETGFSKEEILRATRRFPQLFSYSPKTLEYRIKEIMTLGYSYEEVIQMIKKLPQMYTYSLKNLQIKIDDMVKLGYNRIDVIRICKISPMIYGLSINTLKKKFEYMRKLGYSDNEIIKITRMLPYFYTINEKSIEQKIDDMVNIFKCERDDVLKMIKFNANFLIHNIEPVIDKAVLLGYNREHVLKMYRAFPQLFSISIDNMKNKANELLNLGYNLMQILSITYICPKIFSYSIDKIRQRIDDLVGFGYTLEQAREITIKLPSIFGFSIDNLREKKDFYDSIGLGNIFIKDPKQIIQSIDLSYARYMFYKSIGIDLTMSNYLMLFYNQSIFKKRFGITNEDLVRRYSYKENISDKEMLIKNR